MKKGTSQGRVEKQSNPARGARALTPNRQSVSVSNNYADSSDSALNPGTAPQHRTLNDGEIGFNTDEMRAISVGARAKVNLSLPSIRGRKSSLCIDRATL
jgi:hypothetical protein